MDDIWLQLRIASSFLTGFPAEPPESEEPTRMVPYLAIVALAIGAVTWLLGLICTRLDSKVAAAFLGTIVVNAFWTVLSRGQDFAAVPVVLRALEPGERDPHERGADIGMVALLAVVLVKLSGVAVLIYHGWLTWLLLVPLLSILFTVEMAMRHGFLPQDERPTWQRRHGFAILVLAFSFLAGPRGVFTGAMVYLLVLALEGWSRRRFGERTAVHWVNGGAELVECLVLLTGVALLS